MADVDQSDRYRSIHLLTGASVIRYLRSIRNRVCSLATVNVYDTPLEPACPALPWRFCFSLSFLFGKPKYPLPEHKLDNPRDQKIVPVMFYRAEEKR